MNIIVVEDESKIRHGIVKLINEEFSNFDVVGEASNGLDGYELIKNSTAEIVITDIKMPKLDGIGMIKKLKEDGVKKYFIILSGYADFSYAKEAIAFGVSEYLLKPTTVDDLREVLQKIEADYIKNASNLNDIFHATILEGEGDSKLLNGYIKADKSYLVMFYLKEKQAIEPLLPELSLNTSIKMPEGSVHLALLNDKVDISKTLQGILKIINQNNQCICSYVKVDDLSKLSEYYGILRKQLKWHISIKADIISQEVIDNIRLNKLQYPSTLEKQATQAIYDGKFEELKKVTYQFIEYFTKEPYLPGDILEAYLSYSTNLINNLRQVYKYALQDISQAILLDQLLNCYTYEQLESWLINLLESILSKLDANKVSFIVYKALEIIHNEYNKEISLESVAEKINVTSEYLSSLFSKEMNKNFLSYLTEYRINLAKAMLLNGKLKTVDIAKNVGYASEKYFFSVFKKVTGMSPGKYVMTFKNKEY